jgi:hypothetical protein
VISVLLLSSRLDGFGACLFPVLADENLFRNSGEKKHYPRRQHCRGEFIAPNIWVINIPFTDNSGVVLSITIHLSTYTYISDTYQYLNFFIQSWAATSSCMRRSNIVLNSALTNFLRKSLRVVLYPSVESALSSIASVYKTGHKKLYNHHQMFCPVSPIKLSSGCQLM